MPSPPVPESPQRAPLPGKRVLEAAASSSSGTPRVGMHLYQTDEDDDVSVLTFHTLGTKDGPAASAGTPGSGSGNASYVKSARESLERLLLEGHDGDGTAASLSRISEEEGGSQFSASCHSSRRSCERSNSSSGARSATEKIMEEGAGEEDDDTISLAESILESTSTLLSSIGSSPYYGRGKKQSLSHPKAPPKKQSDGGASNAPGENAHKTCSSEREATPFDGTATEQQLEVSSNFLSSYFGDENAAPSRRNGKGKSENANAKSNNGSTGSAPHAIKKGSASNKDEAHLQKLESETRQLHRLLKERQLDTRKASQTLGSSIRRANDLLERIAAGRAVRG